MRALLKFLGFLVVLALVAGAVAWFWAGRQDGPAIDLRQPGQFVGQESPLEVMIESPDGRFAGVEITLEQGDRTFPVFSQEPPATPPATADPAERIYVMRTIGKKTFPELQDGPARIVVRAARPVLYGVRTVESTSTRDVTVRLEPPRVAVLSTFHFINQGGSEFVVYRATPEDVESGVRVGDIEYRGFPASGAGITSDPAARVAFFALLYDQDPDSPIVVYARDPAGNETSTPLDHRVFPKAYRRSRIALDERFLQRVVPAIAANAPQAQIPTDDILAGFLKINRDLRRENNQYLADLSKKTSPEMLFRDAFEQLGGSQVEAGFADARTYIYEGKEVDQQVHLGYDLARTANVPLVAAQRGIVLHASDLGIYGNCVVIDHGMGVQSVYGHMSSIEVAPGDMVEKGQQIGRSGMTGLAGGDHLHFTMLVGGQQVNPIDWWSPQWMQDRVLRKIMAAGGVR